MMKVVKPSLGSAWQAAAQLSARWLDRRERVDVILESVPPSLGPADRGRCQHLFYGLVRNFGRIEAILGRLVAHPPRFITRAVLYTAVFELIEAQGAGAAAGDEAKIVHHAVEMAKELASAAEARLVNAVARKAAAAVAAQRPPAAIAPAEALADYYSHPEWLVRRWLPAFGAASTRALLEWNQAPAPVYARWRAREAAPPVWLQPTRWPGFFQVPSGHWKEMLALVESGAAYLQDPATRLCVELLAPKAGEEVLDLCAAPGGKSLLAADAMGAGRIVSVDVPDGQIERLKENLSRLGGVQAALVQGDVREGLAKVLSEHRLPTHYPAVLIDVPCSNTGVMRHRIDVKWRLQEADFAKHGRQQGVLLSSASRLVSPGGRLVYSTCSIDAAENEDVVKAFLSRAHGFELERSVVALPWVDGHDGAAAFLFRRT
ncbi:MAG TPA: RsmB/NOP family class I SAM-dependent RNA methyltransferase [Opitutaceae bacterium]